MGKDSFAFLSMEYGLEDVIPIYAGGLGILSGDEMKSAADLRLRGFALGLLYRRGYHRQEIRNGWQQEIYDPYSPEMHMTRLQNIVRIPIEDRQVAAGVWRLDIPGRTGNRFPLFLLDTDYPGNNNRDDDRRYSWFLYGADSDYRLKQEVLLGTGSVKLIDQFRKEGWFQDEFGEDAPSVYHINEGHGALVIAELLKQGYSVDDVIKKVIFTTHTPVPAGHDRFSQAHFDKVLNGYFPERVKQTIHALGDETLPDGSRLFNMTNLALNGSSYRNAVSELHGRVARQMFQRDDIDYNTNGVHSSTWTSKPMQELYDKYLPEWRDDPSVLSRVRIIPRNKLFAAQQEATLDMLEEVNKHAILPGGKLDPHKLTLGFARRYATYKRGSLLFHDMKRLLDVGEGKIQLVYAGKAHPQDGPGKEIIHNVIKRAEELGKRIPTAFLPNYSMRSGLLLTSGCHVWLNAPKVGFEASGTSGMKAAHNMRPHASMDDGWWCEAKTRGGWTFGDGRNVDDVDASMLYNLICAEIIPAFGDPERWAEPCYGAGENAAVFNTHRSMKQYVTQGYKKRLEDMVIPMGGIPVAAMAAQQRTNGKALTL